MFLGLARSSQFETSNPRLSNGSAPKLAKEEEIVLQAPGDLEMELVDKEPKPTIGDEHEAHGGHYFFNLKVNCVLQDILLFGHYLGIYTCITFLLQLFARHNNLVYRA